MNNEFPEEDDFPLGPEKSNFLLEYKLRKARQRMEPNSYKFMTSEQLFVASPRYVHIPLFSGRPDRATVINDDDITNLIIDLETNQI